MAIAANYFDIGNTILAKHYTRLALDTPSSSKNSRFKEVICFVNLAKIEKFENHNVKALEHVYTALELCNTINKSQKCLIVVKEAE